MKRWLLLAAVTGGLVGAWFFFKQTPAPSKQITVVRGDTLFVLAKQHGVTVDELRAWNNIEGDLIEVGQVLHIYTEAPAGPAPTSPKRPKRNKRKNAPAQPEAAAPGRTLPPKPKAQSCQDPPDLEEDEGMVASMGLSRTQIKAGLDPVLSHAMTCLPEGWAQDVALDTEITVGCNGLVTQVKLLDTSGLDADTTTCFQGVLSRAGFAGHDMPDGMTFGYPVHVSF